MMHCKKSFFAILNNFIGFIISCIASIILGLSYSSAYAADTLSKFAYQEITIIVTQKDGIPVPEAAVYGFCKELNLVCPRRDNELDDRNDILWHESYLGRTDQDGKLRVTLPPGKWGFFSAGVAQGDSAKVVVAWSIFKDISSEKDIILTPTLTNHWNICLPNDSALTPSRIFFKPNSFPVWIPINVRLTDELIIERSSGEMKLWASGDGMGHVPGFILDCGVVNNGTRNGKIIIRKPLGKLVSRGGNGLSTISWLKHQNFGLDGTIKLNDSTTVLLSPGDFTFSYRRILEGGFIGNFVGQYYNVKPGKQIVWDFDKPLEAGIDQRLEESDKDSNTKLAARLYIVDGNGHLLRKVQDPSGDSTKFAATIVLNNRHFDAMQIEDENKWPGQKEIGQTFFRANLDETKDIAGAKWKFITSASIINNSEISIEPNKPIVSKSFKIEVPKVLERHAQNILAQAELIAELMEINTGRKRERESTDIIIIPGLPGASASHSGLYIKFGTKFFYSDTIIFRHDFVHELGHNFNLFHGGQHETIIEITRCGNGEQISQQPAKWMFFDRMNGLSRKEILYPNTGLYLYCYAQRGKYFLQFMLLHEYTVRDKMIKDGYNQDDVTTALCTLAMGRDMTSICSAYGLNVSKEKYKNTLNMTRQLCVRP